MSCTRTSFDLLMGIIVQDGVPTDAEQLANSLQTWLTTPAYPVITLSADNTTLRQQLFHSWTPHESDGSIGNLSSQQGNWTIPLHLSLLSSSQPDHWQLMTQAETVLPVDVAVSRTGESSDSGSNEGGDESEGDESEGNEGSDDNDLAAAQQRSRTVLLSKGGHGLHRTLYSNEQFAQLLLELQNGPAETAGDGADFGPLIDVSRLLQDAFEVRSLQHVLDTFEGLVHQPNMHMHGDCLCCGFDIQYICAHAVEPRIKNEVACVHICLHPCTSR